MSQPILLVEDEEHDIIFMQLAFQGAQITNPLEVAKDGQEALDYLRGVGKFQNRKEHALPRLVLLDLRLPYVPGLAVLRWIRAQPNFASIPIIIVTSSDQDSDVDAAYRLGADAYIVKPSHPAELEQIVLRLKRYWIDQDRPPPDCGDWLAVTVSPLVAEAKKART